MKRTRKKKSYIENRGTTCKCMGVEALCEGRDEECSCCREFFLSDVHQDFQGVSLFDTVSFLFMYNLPFINTILVPDFCFLQFFY